LLVVLALHGLLLLILRDALSRASRVQHRELAMVWLDLAPSRPQAEASAAARPLTGVRKPSAPRRRRCSRPRASAARTRRWAPCRIPSF